MRRGEIWRISGPLGREHIVLITGNDVLEGLYPTVQVIPVFDPGTARDTLVTVTLPDEPRPGVALVAGVYPVRRQAGLARLGAVPPEVMERIDIALRAVFDL